MLSTATDAAESPIGKGVSTPALSATTLRAAGRGDVLRLSYSYDPADKEEWIPKMTRRRGEHPLRASAFPGRFNLRPEEPAYVRGLC